MPLDSGSLWPSGIEKNFDSMIFSLRGERKLVSVRRMETQSTSPLAARFAGLHAAVEADSKSAWIPAVIHAAIAAIFARIFGRLEQLIQLWQAGQLTQPKCPQPPRATP